MLKLGGQIKSKVTFTNPDLSAYAISNLLKEIQSQTKIAKTQGAQGKQENVSGKDIWLSDLGVLNLKLTLNEGQSTIYGELPISDFLLGEANAKGKENFKRLGEDIKYDNYLHLLNNSLKDRVIQAWQQNKDIDWEQVRKEITEVKAYEGGKKEHLLLRVLLYSYIQPIQGIIGMNIAVPKSFEDFQKQFSEKKVQIFYQYVQSKDLKIDSSNAKIKRVDVSKKLPQPGRRNILITSALPYVNNVPHLGNIIGCVLSADVFARYCRLRGHNTIYICGTDEYGTATETKAIEEGKTPKQICDHYYEIHKKIYEWFDCDFEYFGRTTTQKQTEIAQDIFLKLHENKFTYEQIMPQQFCPKCSRFLADRLVAGECPLCHFYDAKGDQCDGCGKLLNATELINPKCKTCGATPEVKESNHIFIDLPNIQPLHYKWFKEAHVKGNWSENAVQFTESLIKEGLQGRCITRDLKWGTPVPVEKFKEKVFYVWFDAPIGYISITANYIDQWEKWWKNPEQVELYQFMGKDNITFHTVIFPSSLHGTKENWTFLHHISTTEFLNYEIDEKTGKPKKFSKTRKTGVFGDDAINTGISSEVWRYYLLVNRPEHQDTVFLWNDFQAKNNSELLANLGNFSNRCLKYIESTFKSQVPSCSKDLPNTDKEFLKKLYEIFEEYLYLMDSVKIKDALRVAMSYSQHCNGYWQDQKPWDLIKSDSNRCSQVVFVGINALFLLASILEPFIPSFSAKVYNQMNVKRTEREERLYEFIKDHSERILELVPCGHKIGTPLPIFREISNDEIQKWRSEFGGGKN